jgi:hypothetical protein
LDEKHLDATFHFNFTRPLLLFVVLWKRPNSPMRFNFIVHTEQLENKLTFRTLIARIRAFLFSEVTVEKMKENNRWRTRVDRNYRHVMRKEEKSVNRRAPGSVLTMQEYWGLTDLMAFDHIRLRPHEGVQIVEVVMDVNRQKSKRGKTIKNSPSQDAEGQHPVRSSSSTPATVGRGKKGTLE